MALIYADAVVTPDVPRHPSGRGCCYCGTPVRALDARHRGGTGSGSSMIAAEWHSESDSLLVCDLCGWWCVTHDVRGEAFGIARDGEPEDLEFYEQGDQVVAVLKKLDLSNVELPLDELRRYLIARYSERCEIGPTRFEDVVASVFRDLGYRVLLTARSGDCGIDILVFEGATERPIGIQVKRYRGRIEADQIREFTGALYNQGLLAGVFVTTSSYRRGALNEARKATSRGIAIELWDAGRFYDCLRVAQRPPYNDAGDPTAPFAKYWK